ncbi:hypothetical protein [Azohydromonas lata]|uniref:hypothetical protein n=1 Tax=Azohydromonas lata TaxID=45677 RepID=UPI0012F4A7A4|nr:hypothetical protein [Azohydromonas lata]
MQQEHGGAMPPHDVDKWGPLKAEGEDGRGVALVRLADMVRYFVNAKEIPLKPAAKRVIAVLQEHGPLQLYKLRPGDWASLVEEDARWLCQADQLVISFWDTQPTRNWVGWNGFLAALHEFWVDIAEKPSDLDMFEVSEVAMSARDAQTLGLMPTPAPVLTLAPAPAVAGSSPPVPELRPAKSPGDVWTPAHLAELLRQFQQLTASPYKLKAEVAHAEIGNAWAMAPNSVKAYLSKARKEVTNQRQRRRA